MNLAGYIRVSTEGQVDAFGKEVQRNYINDWAEMNGHTIVRVYEEDGVSGKTDSGDRPALSALIAAASVEGFEGVVAFDPTRLARRLYVQETLLALLWGAGLRVFTTTAGEIDADEDDPTRILIRQIFGVLSEFEHRTIVRRLNSGRKAKSARGGYIGGTPKYGLHVVGTGKAAQFTEDEVESKVIDTIVRLHGCGFSLRQIAGQLNRMNTPTKMGKTWLAPQVQRIIQRHQHAQP